MVVLMVVLRAVDVWYLPDGRAVTDNGIHEGNLTRYPNTNPMKNVHKGTRTMREMNHNTKAVGSERGGRRTQGRLPDMMQIDP